MGSRAQGEDWTKHGEIESYQSWVRTRKIVNSIIMVHNNYIIMFEWAYEHSMLSL